ncbi:FkbM family methyltransferase [Candidatus Peregrinibacteria bacterium]|jgi:FkbM family methyltransferase|nr:FkbM family methyltransferase [Candidatus Peregrinibacteria bacterium]MBT7484221.1 FkbM family methyltransferase [Candidatus Peregrinibacteria bacterium]
MLPRINLIQTTIGQFLVFSTEDFISKALIKYGTWEPTTLKTTQFLLKDVPTPHVYDVGANLGAYAVPVGNMIAKDGGQVYSYEAQRIVYNQLCGNTFLNRLDNVFPHNLAVSNKLSKIAIPVVDYSRSTNIGATSLDENIRKGRKEKEVTSSEEVKAIPLDSLISEGSTPKCSLLKIDVEGMELEVIQGAEKFLETNQFPPIIFEVWSAYPWYEEKKQAIFDKLSELGYEHIIKGEMAVAQHPSYPYFKSFEELKTMLGI